jgi:hypothetical protein
VVISHANAQLSVVYLGLSGVLHPSESLYRLIHGRSPWDDGHLRFESAWVLQRALEPWPSVCIVLTSTLPWAHGLGSVLSQLHPSLASRVIGYTFEDLTTKALRQVTTRSGATRWLTLSSNDYWRMSKAELVASHVEWLRPARWIAIDDESLAWARDVRRDRLVLVDGCKGLSDAKAQDRLLTVVEQTFGRSG